VFAPKGGVGATTLAVNVGAAVAASGERSCVVDLDLQLGDTLSFLDIQGGYTVSDVLANIRRLDRDLVDASIAKHRTGVAVLAQTERIEEAERIDAGEVGRLLTFLRPHFAHVFVDGIRAFDEIGLAALDAADRILIPVTQEVPAVRSAQRCVDVFRKLGYAETKVQVVVNRFHKSSNITCDVIAETIGVPVAATVANDYAALQRAMHGGKTLQEEAPRSAAARDVQALAQLVGGVRAPRPRGVLERLFSKGEAHGTR
jgi:pilus assembly protein CpaE